MALDSGSRLGSYEILASLGKGGMGEVWEARDTRLGRLVAVKVLPAELASDRRRLQRFEAEARLASSLNHPNIVTIHEIGATGADTYLVMERVEGQTLRALLGSGALPLRRILAIAAQAADGLARAHAAGVVHRDLKPENLMVTRGGLVKILDFGLAKLTAPADEGASESVTASLLTAEGTLVGTVAYMSPEQAAGRPVDFRSDQFSLGTILYEMISGRRPFSGGSIPETLAAIIGAEPQPLASLAPEAAPLRWLIERCLAKEPGERYASTEDLAYDLRALRDRLGESSRGPATSAPASRSRKGATLAAGLLGLAAGLAIALLPVVAGRLRPPAPLPARAPRVSQLTPGGREYGAAISPDGKTFAYRSEEAGNAGLFVRQVSGGEPVRLTREGVPSDLVYAPDGESLYYVTDADSAPSIWRIGVLGGTPRKIANGARFPAPSADGKQLAWVRTRSGSNVTIDRFVIEIASPDGASARALYEAEGVQGISLSPDGRSLAFSDGALFAPRTLKILDIPTRKVRAVTSPADGNVYSAAWLPDGKRLVTSIGVDRFPMATGMDLVLVRADGAGVERLLPNVNARLTLPSVSADGRWIVSSMERTQMELWKAPVDGDPDANGRNARLLLDSRWAPFWSQVSQDGRTVLFDSKAKGAWNLYTMPADGSAAPRQITFFSGNVVMHASLSPDGARVAYASQQDGLAEIWVAGVDGAGARKVSNDGGPDYWPIWSRDGRFILYSSKKDTATFRVYRVSADGGSAEPLPGGDGGLRGDVSPVDEKLVYWSDDAIRLLDGVGRELLRVKDVTDLRWSLPVFSPDGRVFTALKKERPGNRAVWVYDAVSGAGRPLVRFPGAFEPVFRAGWADGGRSLVVNRVDSPSNVILVGGF